MENTLKQLRLLKKRTRDTTGMAGQWQLMWWRFRKHKLALVSGIIVILIYLMALFCEFLAPSLPATYSRDYMYAPPQRVKFIIRNETETKWQLHVNGYDVYLNKEALRHEFTLSEEKIIPIGFFVKGESYKMWGLFNADRHLIGPMDPEQPFFIFGADRLGRDILSRVIYGSRISMSIGLVGVIMSLFLGVLLGGISGYFGGLVDTIIQRIIEFLRSIPTIPLWMGLAAAIPKTWSAIQVYFAITVILSFISWTGLARVVRGRFLSLKTEDFVVAARLNGCSELRIIMKHMVPSFLSHIIASVTLSIPRMIISETSLSFLGIGLQPPVVSWGVLLQESQNVRSVSSAPWLLMVPAFFVILAVLTMNFLGDGLRDAADPYNT
jgi:peptide/nickel transport system permease protein